MASGLADFMIDPPEPTLTVASSAGPVLKSAPRLSVNQPSGGVVDDHRILVRVRLY